jgi:TonB family protein
MICRKIVLQFIGIFFFFVSYSQDTLKLYLDNNFVITETESATIKRTAIIKDNRYYVTDQFIDGRMINYGEYKSVNPWIEDGLSKHYNEDGSLYSSGNYINGQLTGEWIYYMPLQNDTVNYQSANDYFNSIKDSCSLGQELQVKGNAMTEEMGKSIIDFLQLNSHLPAKSRTIPKDYSLSIDLILDTDGSIKCPLVMDDNPDINIEMIRVLSDYHCDEQINKPIRLIIPFILNQAVDFGLEGLWFVEVNASFQGNDINAFSDWVRSQLIYPSEASSRRIQGKVFVQFSVNSIGEVCDVQAVRKVHPLLDNEAIRVVRNSPKWIPAKTEGKNVKQIFVIPVAFNLQ